MRQIKERSSASVVAGKANPRCPECLLLSVLEDIARRHEARRLQPMNGSPCKHRGG
jgi:hypothetical protein